MFYMFIAFRLILTIFFFTDTASTEIYTLSLHDALPFCADLPTTDRGHDYITCLETDAAGNFYFVSWHRSEEHTSELQSHSDLVCRLLLEKKKKKITTTTISFTYYTFRRIQKMLNTRLHL